MMTEKELVKEFTVGNPFDEIRIKRYTLTKIINSNLEALIEIERLKQKLDDKHEKESEFDAGG